MTWYMPTFNLVHREANMTNLEKVIRWTAPKLSDFVGRLLVLPVRVENEDIFGTVESKDMLWEASSIGAIPVFNGAVHNDSTKPRKESECECVWIHFEDDLPRFETGQRQYGEWLLIL
jgi:hypothetical protein